MPRIFTEPNVDDLAGLGSARGLIVDAGPKPLTELLRVAGAASRCGTQVSFTGTRRRPLEDLMRIAAAGGDCVSFSPDPPPRGSDDAGPHTTRREEGRSRPFRGLFSRVRSN